MFTNFVKCNVSMLRSQHRFSILVSKCTVSTTIPHSVKKKSDAQKNDTKKHDIQNYDTKLEYSYDSGALVLNHGALARLADSSATGKFNNTNILVTIVNKPKSPPAPFLPLTVDYLHKASAAGKIPSTFTRRDGMASNYEILVSRMVDRSIRPLFGQNYSTETQIVCNLLAYDGKDNADVLAINTVSFALHGSTCNWHGPIGCVRVGMLNDEFVINPSRRDLGKSPLNLVLTVGPNKNILMIEGWADNLNQAKFSEALEFGTKEAFKLVQAIKKTKLEIKAEQIPLSAMNYIPEITASPSAPSQYSEGNSLDVNELLKSLSKEKLYEIITNVNHDKFTRDKAISDLRNTTVNKALKANPACGTYQELSEIFSKYVKQAVRDLVLKESKRVDGRAIDELRPISCQVSLFESLHGSALFQRGQTQVLCSITFDSPDSMYKQDSIFRMMSPSITNFNKNFMLHYEFPSFATNEISRIGGRADRREIGHGALAEKAVYPLFPENFQFTVRSLCEVLESNGSSSMASVCATSLALMDAGVAVKEPVCGVAMGIFVEMDKTGEKIIDHKILTDISGLEDYMGDMDFKVAGTTEGITALQADFKIHGLPIRIVKEVLHKSKSAREKILQIMNSSISKAREELKENAPVFKKFEVPMTQRSRFVGTGACNLKNIYEKTGVTVNSVDDTSFSLFAPNKSSHDEAEEMIQKLLEQPKEPELEFGGIYSAKIVQIVASGLMIQIFPNMKPALLPNSQIDGRKIGHASASEFKVGQEIQIKYFGRDPVDGRMRVSRKALFKTNSPAKDLMNPSKEQFNLHQ